MGRFFEDFRFGVRTLATNPLFTAVAAVSLGLGVGAVTAVYGLVSSVLIHTVPFEDPERIVALENIHLQRDSIWSVSYPLFLDWQEQNEVCEYISVFSGGSFNLSGPEGAQSVQSGFVTASFFPLLRVQPILGRTFLPEEDEFGQGNVVMLGHRLWMDRYEGRENILGQGITLDAEPYTVVGVIGPEFHFLYTGDVELWVPASARQWANQRGNHWLNAMARLKEGVSYEQAATAMTAITQSLAETYPRQYQHRGVGVKSFGSDTTEDMRVALLILLGSVTFVLMISCANVANLLLARVAGRQKEITVRVALGASRGRLIRQLLTESLVLAAMGGALGVLFAKWGMSGIISLLPDKDAQFYVSYFRFGLNAEILSVAAGVTVLTAFVFGLIPALQASNPDLTLALKEGGGPAGLSRKRHRFLRALVACEVALAMVLLVSGGLMMRSYQNLRQVDPGFEASNLLVISMNLPAKSYPSSQVRSDFFNRVEERLRGLSGVESVGCITILPFSDSNSNNTIFIEGQPDPGPGNYSIADVRSVTATYAETMGVTLLRGRMFEASENRPGAPIALIDDAMAQRHWPDGNPVGKRFKRGYLESKGPWITVVGVLSDVRHGGFDSAPRPTFFEPYAQNAWTSMNVVVRTSVEPESLARSVRGVVKEMDPNQAIRDVRTMEEVIEDRVWGNRFNATLFSGLSAVALLLATVGLYGVMSYSVSQRTHEIGLRMALGAGGRDVLRLVVLQGLWLALIGVGLGLPAAFGLTRLMQSMLYEVSASDPLTYAGIALLLLAVTLSASYVPARRAMRVEPYTALRQQ